MNPPLQFVEIAFNDYGGIGFEFRHAVLRGAGEKGLLWFGLGRTQEEVGVPAKSLESTPESSTQAV